MSLIKQELRDRYSDRKFWKFMNVLSAIIVILILLLIGAEIVSGSVKKKVDIVQSDNQASVWIGKGEIKIYKYVDDKNTCYVSVMDIDQPNFKNISHNLSCK